MVISKRKELRTHDQSTKLFENPEQLMKERGTCETKKVQPKQLEGTECITDPAPSTPRKLKLKKPENGKKKVKHLVNLKTMYRDAERQGLEKVSIDRN